MACLLHQRGTQVWPSTSHPFLKAKVSDRSVALGCHLDKCSALHFPSGPTDGILPALPVLACTQDRQLPMREVAGEEVPCVWWREGVIPAMLLFALEVDPVSWPTLMHIVSNYCCHFQMHKRQEIWVASSWNNGNQENRYSYSHHVE